MGQDEAIKVVGAIAIAVLAISFAVFVIGKSSRSANDLSNAASGNVGTLTGSIGDLAS